MNMVHVLNLHKQPSLAFRKGIEKAESDRPNKKMRSS